MNPYYEKWELVVGTVIHDSDLIARHILQPFENSTFDSAALFTDVLVPRKVRDDAIPSLVLTVYAHPMIPSF